MLTTPSASGALHAYYKARGDRFSESAERCGWLSSFTQSLRFQALTAGWDLSSASVLDVGCGCADLLVFLETDYTSIQYTGLDCLSDFIVESQTRYPHALFIETDFFAYEATPLSYDYVVAVGPFNHLVEDNYAALRMAMVKLFSLAKVGVAISLLSDLSPKELRRAEELFYYDPQRVLAMALELTPFVELKTQYLPNDMAMILYR
jgi:SAM-dependent methyltransferase